MRITLARSKTIPSYIILDGYRASHMFGSDLEDLYEKYSSLIGELLTKRRGLILPEQTKQYHEIGRQIQELIKQHEQEVMLLRQKQEGEQHE